mmetsp:Transcript_5251/g.13493  ORF Transcript_5251/g.13493 Transcript_5251/m.13493 type:complete len:358 (-) Transcript_5251:501-1574(-)
MEFSSLFVHILLVGHLLLHSGLRLLLLLQLVARLVHHVLGCPGQRHVARREGISARQGKPALLVGRDEGSALEAVADVEVRKPVALRHGHGARPDEGAHGGDAVGLGGVRVRVLALVTVDLDGPGHGALGILRLQLLEVGADGLEHALLRLCLLLGVDSVDHLLRQGALLQAVQVRPGALAFGEEERRSVDPAFLRGQCIVRREFATFHLFELVLAHLLIYLVVARDREVARRRDACNLCAQEVALLARKPGRGKHRAAKAALEHLLNLAGRGDVASPRSRQPHPRVGAARGDPVGVRVGALAAGLDVVLGAARQRGGLRRGARGCLKRALGHVVVALRAKDLAPEAELLQGGGLCR